MLSERKGAGQGCISRERTSEAAPEGVRQAVGGHCRSGWGRLLSQMPLKPALAARETMAGHRLSALAVPPALLQPSQACRLKEAHLETMLSTSSILLMRTGLCITKSTAEVSLSML